MILDAITVLLTGSIAAAATWMAIGLIRRTSDRTDKLAVIGLQSTWWGIVLGLSLGVAVCGLIIGWWIAPIGIAAIVAIKLGYLAALVAYRRKGQARDRDHVTVLMAAHSAVAVVALGLLMAA